jgi:hypothetical protein
VAPLSARTPQIKRRNLVQLRAKGSRADNGHYIIGTMIAFEPKGVPGPRFHQLEDGAASYANAIASLVIVMRMPEDPVDSQVVTTARATTWGPVGLSVIVAVVILLSGTLELPTGPLAPSERGGVTTALRRYLLVTLISIAHLGLRAHTVTDPGIHAQPLATSPPSWTRRTAVLAMSSSGLCRGSAGQPGCICLTSTTR